MDIQEKSKGVGSVGAGRPLQGWSIDMAGGDRMEHNGPDTGEPAFSLAPSTSWSLRFEQYLRKLFLPENRNDLERYRFSGSANRVYRIPLADAGLVEAGEQFVIVKLLPSRWSDMRRRFKKLVRNTLYGERDYSAGRQRARLEIERVTEWAKEGLPVPPVVATSLPDVRVFVGLPFPTFYTVLTDRNTSTVKKLETLAVVTRALSFQHETAFVRGKKSLIHRDGGPWNLMVDQERGQVYWFDLEQPADYPSISLEDLAARAFRVFLHGVLTYMWDQEEAVVRTIVANYAHKDVVRAYVQSMDKYSHSLSHQVVGRVKKNVTSKLLDRGLIGHVQEALAIGGGSSSSTPASGTGQSQRQDGRRMRQ